MQRILVTGARAKTGAPLVERLSRRSGVEVLAGSRNPDALDVAGVRPTLFDWDDSDTWGDATADVNALFLVRPDREDAPDLVGGLLDAAPRAAHLVLLSEVDGGYFPPDSWATRVENVVRSSGMSWTVLRPTWFMQVFTDPRFFLEEIRVRHRLPFVSGGQGVAWIDARDIAAVAERALVHPGHEDRVYALSGPQSLTIEQTAAILSRGVGKQVEPVEMSMEEALGDTSGFVRENDFGAFDRVRRGMAGTLTDTVKATTGTSPRSFGQFVADHAAQWREDGVGR